MQKPKYNIGDEVYMASWDSREAYAPCAYCGGTCAVDVHLFDGTVYTIDCEGCKRGWMGSTGKSIIYERTPKALKGVVSGVEINRWNDGNIEYRVQVLDITYCPKEENVFFAESEALSKAELEIAALHKEELDKVNRKDKEHKSWAWHVKYHRDLIKRAEKDMAYHTACLNVAKQKSKELTA